MLHCHNRQYDNRAADLTKEGMKAGIENAAAFGLEHAARRCKILPLLLRAGASINEPAITAKFQEFQNLYKNDPNKPHYRKAIEYLRAVRAAGGFPAYARAHRSMFAAIFSRGTRLPADVIPKIVDYWAHLGWYKYTQ